MIYSIRVYCVSMQFHDNRACTDVFVKIIIRRIGCKSQALMVGNSMNLIFDLDYQIITYKNIKGCINRAFNILI